MTREFEFEAWLTAQLVHAQNVEAADRKRDDSKALAFSSPRLAAFREVYDAWWRTRPAPKT